MFWVLGVVNTTLGFTFHVEEVGREAADVGGGHGALRRHEGHQRQKSSTGRTRSPPPSPGTPTSEK